MAIIHLLHSAHPPAVSTEMKLPEGGLALHVALSGCGLISEALVMTVLEWFPQAASHGAGQYSPLFKAIRGGASTHVVRRLIELHPSAVLPSQVETGELPADDLPLHVAIRCRVRLDLILEILRHAPHAALISNSDGLRPLELLMHDRTSCGWYDSTTLPAVCQALLHAAPSVVCSRPKNSHGAEQRLPFEEALARGAHAVAIEILQACPDAAKDAIDVDTFRPKGEGGDKGEGRQHGEALECLTCRLPKTPAGATLDGGKRQKLSGITFFTADGRTMVEGPLDHSHLDIILIPKSEGLTPVTVPWPPLAVALGLGCPDGLVRALMVAHPAAAACSLPGGFYPLHVALGALASGTPYSCAPILFCGIDPTPALRQHQ